MKIVAMEAFFEELAKRSGEVILPFFRSQIHVTDKTNNGSAFDPVTEADRAAESVIRTRIKQVFPSHGFLGEEFGSENENAEYVWVIDPIDGTRSFVCGIPLWGTLIGLLKDQNPVYGLMHQPYIGETFFGDGKKATITTAKGIRSLAVRPCDSLSDTYLMTTTPSLFTYDKLVKYQAVERQSKLVRYGADCYAYMMLASGQIDLVIETGLKPYDILPLIPIIEGAGGIVTNWNGGPVGLDGDIIAAGDKRVHAAALHALNTL
jgi:histidinol phosphatase-like enzyme (inositol monophosphatase family)